MTDIIRKVEQASTIDLRLGLGRRPKYLATGSWRMKTLYKGKGYWQEPYIAKVQKDHLPFVIDAKVSRVHVGLGEN